MAGVPLSEYIRRRKMSLAAVDLQDKNAKIIDVAAKYISFLSISAQKREYQIKPDHRSYDVCQNKICPDPVPAILQK